MKKVIDEINKTMGTYRGCRLELKRWETDSFPGMGRPQGLINMQIGSHDVFVGIMWKRFGAPTDVAESGTEEEFNRAYETWSRTGKPHIMFYFCTKSFYPVSSEDNDQMAKVLAFRQRIEKKGLYDTYSDPGGFADVVRPGLIHVIEEVLNQPSRLMHDLDDQSPAPATSMIQAGQMDPEPAPIGIHAESISSNIPLPRIPRTFSDLEKRRFISDTLTKIRSYFEIALVALKKGDPRIDYELRDINAESFMCDVYLDGKLRNSCKIWIGGIGTANGLSYQEGQGIDPNNFNSFNGWVSITDDGFDLSFMSSLGDPRNSVGYGRYQTSVAQGQIVEDFWTRFAASLG